MEPPVGPSDDDLNDNKAEVFRAIPAPDSANYARGQSRGYTDIPGVADGSQTETFVALGIAIEHWHWAGVPIFLRAGKAAAREGHRGPAVSAPHSGARCGAVAAAWPSELARAMAVEDLACARLKADPWD
jgi:hypothetical protein